MRIVSGKYGGRVLETPKNNKIRPTSDKVRGAIFNALGSREAVYDAHIIDCFCGTGALGLEGLSQGAQSCLFVDADRKSLELAKQNAQNLGVGDEPQFLLKNIQKIHTRPEDVTPRTLAFLDPPYGQDLITDTLEALSVGGWLAPGAICVVEAEKALNLAPPKFFEVLSEKEYGDTKVMFLKYAV